MPSRKKETKLIRSLDTAGFYSDFDKNGSLFAALIRSPSPAGKIKSINAPYLPEGYFIFTEKDIPGAKTIRINKTQIKVFENKNISYAGEPIGIVAGPDERTVLQILDNISLSFDVENLETALKNVIKNNIKENADESSSENISDFVNQINEMPSLDAVIDKTQVEENPFVTIATREVRSGLYKDFSIEEADKIIFGPDEKNQKNAKTSKTHENFENSDEKNSELQNEDSSEKNENQIDYENEKNDVNNEINENENEKIEEHKEISDNTAEIDAFQKESEEKNERAEDKKNQENQENQNEKNIENIFENQETDRELNAENTSQDFLISEEKNAEKRKNLLYFSDTWEQEISSQRWQETEGVFCYMDGADFHIYVPTKWTYLTQKAISEVLGLKIENIFIHKTKTSGIYPTGLWKTTQIALQAAVASFITKKPIKLSLTQREQDLYMKPGVCTKITYKTAVEPNGHIFAMKIKIDIDVGSDNPFAQEITDRIALASCSFYKPENLYIYANTYTSRTPPTTISIKVADSQAFFAVENEIQKISEKTGILPDEIRILNAGLENAKENTTTKISRKNKPVEEKTFPFDIQFVNIQKVMENVLKSSDFNRKYASYQMEANARLNKNTQSFFALPLRGIGLASAYVSSGYKGDSAFSYDSKIDATLTTDDKLVIHCLKPSLEIQKIWKNTASEILQIPEENIIINSDFEIDQLPENPEDTVSSLGIMNELIKKCCCDIQKKRFHQPLPISARRSVPRNAKTKWNKEEFSGNPYLATAFATTIVEIELDTYTYNEKIKGIWVAIDCGELFDEESAIKTIKLEIQQELGMLVKGKNVSCNQIKVNFIKSNNKSGQIGALIHNTLPAAFSSALSLALATQLTKLPCTEDLLFNLIKNRTKS